MILEAMGLSAWVRSICGWQCEATQLYITMSAPFTVSRLQGWSFCKDSEKEAEHWVGAIRSTCPLGGSRLCPGRVRTVSGQETERAVEPDKGARNSPLFTHSFNTSVLSTYDMPGPGCKAVSKSDQGQDHLLV